MPEKWWRGERIDGPEYRKYVEQRWSSPRGGGPTRLLRRLAGLVALLVVLGFGVPVAAHVANDAPVTKAFGATLDDYRALAACPDQAGSVADLLTREDFELGSDVLKAKFCAGTLAERGLAEAPAAIPTPEPTATHAPGETPQPTPAPTPVPIDLFALRVHAITLINEDRLANGLDAVTLGSNGAAQGHAEELFATGYIAHWNQTGLKPYMRYTLAGGTDYEAENISAPDRPRDPDLRYRTSTPEDSLADAQIGLMNSPGHRRNILDPWHHSVSLGIACDDVSCALVQQFEGDYVDYDVLPSIQSGALAVAGELLEGFALSSIQIWYDQPPEALTLGQLDRTFSYFTGQRPMVFVRPPAGPGRFYPDDVADYSWERGPDPYEVSPSLPRTTEHPSPDEKISLQADVPWVTAGTWSEGSEGRFVVQADLSDAITAAGPGVYTVVIWAQRGGDSLSVSNYALWVGL